MRNAHNAELQMHANAMEGACEILQAAIDNEQGEDEHLQQLTASLSDKIAAYTASATTLKKLIVSIAAHVLKLEACIML